MRRDATREDEKVQLLRVQSSYWQQCHGSQSLRYEFIMKSSKFCIKFVNTNRCFDTKFVNTNRCFDLT